jgi:hypothetical protein
MRGADPQQFVGMATQNCIMTINLTLTKIVYVCVYVYAGESVNRSQMEVKQL